MNRRTRQFYKMMNVASRRIVWILSYGEFCGIGLDTFYSGSNVAEDDFTKIGTSTDASFFFARNNNDQYVEME